MVGDQHADALITVLLGGLCGTNRRGGHRQCSSFLRNIRLNPSPANANSTAVAGGTDERSCSGRAGTDPLAIRLADLTAGVKSAGISGAAGGETVRINPPASPAADTSGGELVSEAVLHLGDVPLDLIRECWVAPLAP